MNSDDRLRDEIAYRTSHGCRMLSVKQLGAEFAKLGYRLDRRMDCRGDARYLTGDRAGTSYPVVTTGLTEIATGKSAFHFEGTRDEKYRQMQSLRSEIFAVVKGAILEV